MSGHSKWATIKRKKEKTDAARGKVFSKLIKEITIAARIGGGDLEGNPRLRTAIDIAKNANMPSNNIERAVQKGTGDLEGVNYEEITYEAYGPGGTALLIETLTDNRNRCVSELRHMITKNGGNLGETGSVGWMFSRMGLITVNGEAADEDNIMMAALEAGADDVKYEDEIFLVYTPPEIVHDVKTAITEAGFEVESAASAMIPQTFVPVTGSAARQVLRLIDGLEEQDDVQQVWNNCDIDEAILQEE